MKRNHDKQRNLALGRLLGVLLLACGWVALYATHAALQEAMYEEGTLHYILENIGRGAMISYIVLTLLIAQKYAMYSPFLPRKERKTADERQLRVRSRVFEKSYTVLAVSSFIAVISFGSAEPTMQGMLWAYVCASYFAIPMFFALIQKDA
jgi:quinol-cytochrome oxidoreductase complex cytochrome b subunit